MPEVNRRIAVVEGVALTPDLWFEDYGLVVEYEGSQHQNDRGQYNADIDRYALYRRHDVPYEQVTKERMRSPKATVRLVHAALVAEGYDRAAAGVRGTVVVPLRAARPPRTPAPRGVSRPSGESHFVHRCGSLTARNVGWDTARRAAPEAGRPPPPEDATRAGGDPRPSSLLQYVAQ